MLFYLFMHQIFGTYLLTFKRASWYLRRRPNPQASVKDAYGPMMLAMLMSKSIDTSLTETDPSWLSHPVLRWDLVCDLALSPHAAVGPGV